MREILIRCREAIIYAVVFDFIRHGLFRIGRGGVSKSMLTLNEAIIDVKEG